MFHPRELNLIRTWCIGWICVRVSLGLCRRKNQNKLALWVTRNHLKHKQTLQVTRPEYLEEQVSE